MPTIRNCDVRFCLDSVEVKVLILPSLFFLPRPDADKPIAIVPSNQVNVISLVTDSFVIRRFDRPDLTVIGTRHRAYADLMWTDGAQCGLVAHPDGGA